MVPVIISTREQRSRKFRPYQGKLLPNSSSISHHRRLKSSPQGGDNSIPDQNFPPELAEEYLVVDSLHLSDDQRPSLIDSLSNPRDILAVILVLVGLAVSIANVTGAYGDQLYPEIEKLAILLGFASSLAYFSQLANNNNISKFVRRGIVDDGVVTIYAGMYSAAVSWQALRTSSFCPGWLERGDVFFPWVALAICGFSILAPLATLTSEARWLTFWRRQTGGSEESKYDANPKLSDTELLRAYGLLAIGTIACVFAPECISFGLGGQEWWGRVTETHPSQTTLESSTCLFALFATEASMISHRVGKVGVAPYKQIVPVFVVVCLVLAIIPSAAAIYWLGDDISFFSFYTE